MLKCHKSYLNCNWHVSPESHGLNFDSALLTKVYWKYVTHIVRVCVSSKTPNDPNLPFTNKSNLQVMFGSRAMASVYELLCHHPLTNNDPCLRNCCAISLPDFLCKFLTILHRKVLILTQSDQLIHLFPHFIPLIQLIFPKYFFIFLIALCNSKTFTTKTGTRQYKRAAGQERRPYSSRNPPDAASSSNCSRFSVTVRAGNSRSHSRQLKLVNRL